MTRSALKLAALAAAAVPGLEPVATCSVQNSSDGLFDVALVSDSERRSWMVRAPRVAMAGAGVEQVQPLLRLLARKAPFKVPLTRGEVALKEGGVAVVHPRLDGHPVDFAQVPAGSGLAASLGRTLSALHNTDLRLAEEAGIESYDAAGYRARQMATVDRAASTGHVPNGLLARWEQALEDVAIWRFVPVLVHGSFQTGHVLADFDDPEDAGEGRVVALLGWEHAKVADPADDLAWLLDECAPDTFETVHEAYAHTLIDRPDRHILVRARLASELRLVRELLAAVGRRDDDAIAACSEALRHLDATTAEAEPLTAAPPAAAPVIAAMAADEDPGSPAADGQEPSAGAGTRPASTGQTSASSRGTAPGEDDRSPREDDTAPGDSAPGDSAPSDTAPSDTAPSDSAPSDTAPSDDRIALGSADTEPIPVRPGMAVDDRQRPAHHADRAAPETAEGSPGGTDRTADRSDESPELAEPAASAEPAEPAASAEPDEIDEPDDEESPLLIGPPAPKVILDPVTHAPIGEEIAADTASAVDRDADTVPIPVRPAVEDLDLDLRDYLGSSLEAEDAPVPRSEDAGLGAESDDASPAAGSDDPHAGDAEGSTDSAPSRPS